MAITGTLNKKVRSTHPGIRTFKILILFAFALLGASCSQLDKPKTEPFYAQTAPPARQEFRWSNGKMSKTIDPAMAAVPPETDVVRAIFDGLTDIDAKTLEATPAVAEKWTVSEDFKTWTFHLRKDAKWSNGKPVTANDFVTSWKRLVSLGDAVPRSELYRNIVGMKVKKIDMPPATTETEGSLLVPSATPSAPFLGSSNSNTSTAVPKSKANTTSPADGDPLQRVDKPAVTEPVFGAEAIDDHTLKVTLVEPDKQFPRLAANPVFRPIYGDGTIFEKGKLRPDVVTSGAFRITSIGQDGVTLDRAEHYWNRTSVQLERVKFVPKDTAEQALEAYRAGDLDAVTNASFEPLALKLLEPYEDFRRTKHSALNLYEFNLERPPFNDHRVREALAISIERERLTEGELEGSSQPATSFMPFDESGEPKLVQDVERGKMLLAEAGFPEGEKFPEIEILVNRNDAQQRIAKAVAKMWKQNLNIDAKVGVKEASEIDQARESGSFDLVRRGVVLPTSDETANMLAIFASKPGEGKPALPEQVFGIPQMPAAGDPSVSPTPGHTPLPETALTEEKHPILTDEDAMRELSVIPLYFPTSYSLVKSYVQGFVINPLDAPSLKDVRIDTTWQPSKP